MREKKCLTRSKGSSGNAASAPMGDERRRTIAPRSQDCELHGVDGRCVSKLLKRRVRIDEKRIIGKSANKIGSADEKKRGNDVRNGLKALL